MHIESEMLKSIPSDCRIPSQSYLNELVTISFGKIQIQETNPN